MTQAPASYIDLRALCGRCLVAGESAFVNHQEAAANVG